MVALKSFDDLLLNLSLGQLDKIIKTSECVCP